jgi:hypothetical protein
MNERTPMPDEFVVGALVKWQEKLGTIVSLDTDGDGALVGVNFDDGESMFFKTDAAQISRVQLGDVIDLLGAASREQVQIRVVLHRDGEKKNRENLLAAWDVFAVKPKIYTWDPQRPDRTRRCTPRS